MSQTTFSILEAVLISSRSEGNDVEIDIRSNLVEFQIFEHLAKPYIDATIIFVDDFGMRDTLSMAGTEKFRITLGSPDDLNEPTFTKFFFVGKVNSTRKMNERSEIISLNLIEDHLYIDSIKQLSRSYTAPIEEIIEQICSIELGKTVVRRDFEGTAQGDRKIIIPYMSPLQAVSWIKDRATTRTGGPIYLRSILWSNNLILSDFDSLMKVDVVNKKFPLRYSDAISSVDAKDDLKRPYYSVISYNEANADNMLSQYENGNVGSYYSNLDAGTGISSGAHISIRDIVDEFYSTDLISSDTVQTIYDPTLKIGDKLSDEYNSLNIFQITSSNTYNQFSSYHDEAVIVDQDKNIIESKLKVKNKIIRSILKKNILDIGIEGRLIFSAKISTGNRIRVLFLNSAAGSENKDAIEQIDKRKSGDYFILAINHIFKDNTHFSQLRLTKIGELPRDFAIE